MKNYEAEIKWNKRKGQGFEDLVNALLQQMFPNISFEQTRYVHDGGKDFYSIGSNCEEKIWVEAKNYNNHLELSKFSNTFIMADISEINRIILFSMSELTKGAKTNVARYAAYHNKIISVYAGRDILILLNKYKENILLSDYIENANDILQIILMSNIIETDIAISVTYEYYYAKQFNLAYRRDKDNYIKKNNLHSLPLHSLIAQEIHITNHDLFQYNTVKIDCSEYKNNYVESYFHGIEPDYITIPPASTNVIVVFFKIVDIYNKIKLPTIKFQTNVKFENLPYMVECCWLGEIPYMGDGWVKLQETINVLKENPTKKFIVLKGKSGVGKTRFLQEISGYYFRKNYRIISLDFQSITDLSLKNALQSILLNIYNLDSDKSQRVEYIDQFGEMYKDFYDILFNDNYDCETHIDKLCILFISLFKRKKILLLIDNVQDISSETATFFERVLFEINNIVNSKSLIILCFNQDFLFQGKASTRLLAYLEHLNGAFLIELKNFSKNDARIYLRECLDPRELRTDVYYYYDEIIKQFGTNPFVLKQLMLYLKQRNIISFIDSMVCITDFEDMKSVLNELPDGINKILQYRYSYLLRNIPSDSNYNLDRIIWSVLFLGNVQSNFATSLNLDAKGICSLMDYGFLEYNEKAEIVFCHQLIEKSFCALFMNNQYVKNPSLNFIDDVEFLSHFFCVVNQMGKYNLCIENMLLRTRLGLAEPENFNCALKRLTKDSPRPIMLPLVINSINECLNAGIKTDPELEFKALYFLSLACQDRLNVRLAAEYTKNLIIYEQETYKKKLAAKETMIQFFKHHVFQLPNTEKHIFLDWLLDESDNFDLSSDEHENFLGWVHNRYSKNLCEQHRFAEALTHVHNALELALRKKDYCSAAEAEIEYGNIFAYSDAKEASRHWQNSVKYISICNNNSYYFKVYKHGYYILSKLFIGEISDDLLTEINKLQELRQKTFLYQQLLIDDICADYYIIQYMNGDCSFQTLKNLIPQLSRMKTDSYNYTPEITVLATYKLFTVYRLICDVEPIDANVDMGKILIYELIKNNIFTSSNPSYSKMILQDILRFCKNKSELENEILHELPENAKKIFLQMKKQKTQDGHSHALTLLSDKNRHVNLLHFNYIF